MMTFGAPEMITPARSATSPTRFAGIPPKNTFGDPASVVTA